MKPTEMSRDDYINMLQQIELEEWHEWINSHCVRCGEPLACDGSCVLCEQQDHDEEVFDA